VPVVRGGQIKFSVSIQPTYGVVSGGLALFLVGIQRD
jgi:hypothetical protein